MPSHDRRKTLKSRLAMAAGIFLVWSCAIEARLIYLQVFQRDALAARAESQQSEEIELAARRGEILDRNGRILAYSVDAETIYAIPSEIDDPSKVVAALCQALGDCQAKERRTLVDRIKRNRHWASIRRQVSPQQARRVAALKLAGVGFLKESKRFYPNKELGAHLLGYVGTDNGGLSG